MRPNPGFFAPLFMKNHQASPAERVGHHKCTCESCTCQDQDVPTEDCHQGEPQATSQDLAGEEVAKGDDSSGSTTEATDETGDLGQNSDLEALCQELKHLQEQEAELTQKLVRLQADFENYRRRTRKEMQENIIRANEELIGELLPVLDNFDRALVARDEASAESIRNGVELVYRQFLDILGKEGLTPIDTLGEAFDPHVHEAALVEATDDPDLDNQIVQELQKGYCFGDRVIRAAVVKVAKIED